jgi:DNA-binding NarL/FixJ family response regulator
MGPQLKKRILIADDHALLAEGIASILTPEYEVEGIVGDGAQLVEAATRLRPDIIVLDISMPNLSGIEAAEQVRKILPDVRLVFVTQRIDAQYLHAAFRAGACAYVSKQSASSELLTALQHVTEGKRFVTPLLASEDVSSHKPESRSTTVNALTIRQREVLRLIAEGKTARVIGETLNISPKTVEFHKKALMDLTGLRTTAELTKYAVAYGIASI